MARELAAYLNSSGATFFHFVLYIYRLFFNCLSNMENEYVP